MNDKLKNTETEFSQSIYCILNSYLPNLTALERDCKITVTANREGIGSSRTLVQERGKEKFERIKRGKPGRSFLRFVAADE
jgi:hypothetical protein